MHLKDRPARPGSMYRDGMHVDLQWHYHDVHTLLYAFEGAVEVESTLGRNLVPRQLAAWIPAGVPHRTSIHGIRWIAMSFTTDMLGDTGKRVRTVMVSPLMREMLRESMRWRVGEAHPPIGSIFLQAMAKLCEEWIAREANFLLPTAKDARLRRALDYTAEHINSSIDEICNQAGMSARSLRRHLKAETGLTWENYRHRVRLLRAVTLLGETDEPVSEIAALCGFENPSSFSKVFRLEVGETPRDYRNRVKEDSSS